MPQMYVMTMGTVKTRRRVIAFSMLLAFATSALEAVAGPVRDGAVHHETIVEASSHLTVQGAGHNHLGSVPNSEAQTPNPDAPSDGLDDEHPGGDHCTHVHGVPLVPHMTVVFASVVVATSDSPVAHHEDPTYTHIPHPPRA